MTLASQWILLLAERKDVLPSMFMDMAEGRTVCFFVDFAPGRFVGHFDKFEEAFPVGHSVFG